jgi:threonine dehydratase
MQWPCRKRVTLEHVGPFADGVAVKAVGEETFRLCREHVDGIVMVNRAAICASIKVQTMNRTFICMLFLTFFLKNGK